MRMRTTTALAVAAALACAAPAAADPPGNDDFESAAPITTTASGTIVDATRQASEPELGVGSVWYAFTPSTSGRYAARIPHVTDGAAFAVYTGPSLAALKRVAAVDGTSRAVFEAAAGTTYWIAVAGSYEGSTANFTLQVAPAPLPSNDDFAGAQAVKVPSRTTASLADATRELGEPDHAGQRPQHSLWYRFKAPRTGKLSIQARSSECRGTVAIYTGSRLSRLREVESSRSNTARFRARRGRVYRVAADCSFSSIAPMELTISDGSIAGKGVTIEPDPGQTVDSVIDRGLRTVVRARRKVTVGIELRVSRATARDLGLERTVIGSARGTLGYRQSLKATLALTGEARRALRDRESLPAILRVTLLHASAPNRVLNVPVDIPN